MKHANRTVNLAKALFNRICCMVPLLAFCAAGLAQSLAEPGALDRLRELNAKIGELSTDPAQKQAALELANQALEIGKSANPDSIEYAYAIRNFLLLKGVSTLGYRRGADPEAISLARQAVSIAERAFGKERIDTAVFLQLLAGTLRPRESFEIYRTIVEIRTHFLGPQHPDTVSARFEYASALETDGDRLSDRDEFTQATAAFKAALDIYDQYPGVSTSRSELARVRLASVLEKMGEIPRALQLQQEVLASRRKRDASALLVASSMGSMAALQAKSGNPNAAADLYEQALLLAGKNGPQLLVTEWLISSAEVRHALGDRTRALQLAGEAAGIATRRVINDTQRGIAMGRIAVLYEKLGDPAKALEWARRALMLVDKPNGLRGKVAIGVLGVTARLTRSAGEPNAAADLYGRAYKMQAELYGETTLTSVRYLSQKAISLISDGDDLSGCALLRQAMRLHSERLIDVVGTGSDQHLRSFATAGENILNAGFECANVGRSLSAADLFDYSLLIRNVVTDEFRFVVQSVRSLGDIATRALLEDFVKKSNELAALEKAEPDSDPAAHRSKIEELHSAVSESRANLITRSPQFRDAVAEVTSHQLLRLLPPNSVLVDMFAYIRMDRKAGNPFGGRSRYGAMILQRGADARWIDLGPGDRIRELSATLRMSLPEVANRNLYARVAQELHQLLIAPLVASQTQVIEHVYLVPYGALQTMPWAALIGPDGRYLAQEKFGLHLLGSSRDLAILTNSKQFAAGGQQEVVMVAPDYGQGEQFQPLNGAIGEGLAISKLLRRPVLLQGPEATRERLLALKSPRLLHLATHGEYRLGSGGASRTIGMVALAGANNGPDGIVTDRELAGVDLRGTQLVALSACETGRGVGNFADGLFGFQRALAIAGSRSQLLTLWKISDSATRQLMESFYSHLTAGIPKSEALRAAQGELIAKGHPPGEWAAFALFGDPGPLSLP